MNLNRCRRSLRFVPSLVVGGMLLFGLAGNASTAPVAHVATISVNTTNDELNDDGDCSLGNVCVDKTCVAGCSSNRDCPGGLLCDTDKGDHGLCVECLVPTDCGGANETCRDGACVFVCDGDEDCHDPTPACDLLSGTCVQCVA